MISLSNRQNKNKQNKMTKQINKRMFELEIKTVFLKTDTIL
jgi:hypothetical protein